MSMFMQEIKKESKSLESSYERLEYMQEACGDQSIAEGMKQVPVQQHVGLARCLANVKEKCRAQADNIAQKKQVPRTGERRPWAQAR